jgi:hypothetical protein
MSQAAKLLSQIMKVKPKIYSNFFAILILAAQLIINLKKIRKIKI